MPLITKAPEKQVVSKAEMTLDEYHTTPNGKKFVLYHTNWATYGRDFQVKDLPIDIIPEIAYAFFNVDAYGNVVSGDPWADFDKRFVDSTKSVLPLDTWDNNSGYAGNLGQFRKLKEAGKKFNLTLSIGGWSWSKYFSSAVNNSNRTNFINNIIDTLTKYNIFCGVSIDWEYPTNDGVNHGNSGNESRIQDTVNLVETIKLLKFRLSSLNKSHYKISVCCSADPKMIKLADLYNICQVADELHVMTYDFSDFRFSPSISSHHTNLKKCSYSNFSVEEIIEGLISAGIKSTMIFIGAAFYSRGFGGTEGPGKTATTGSTDKSWDEGIVDYKDLPKSGAIEYWDVNCMAPFSYDKDKKIYNSYDNVNSIYYKSRYVLDKNLGGIIVWESSGDTPVSNPRSLTSALYKYLVKEDKTAPVLPPVWGIPIPPLPIPVVPSQPVSNPQSPITPPKQTYTPFWEDNKTYNIEDVVISEGKYYKCRLKHTSNIGWLPKLTNGTLWTAIDPPSSVTQPAPVVTQPAPVVTPIPVPTPVKPVPTPEPTPTVCNCNCGEKVIEYLKTMKFQVNVDVKPFESSLSKLEESIEERIEESIEDDTKNIKIN